MFVPCNLAHRRRLWVSNAPASPWASREKTHCRFPLFATCAATCIAMALVGCDAPTSNSMPVAPPDTAAGDADASVLTIGLMLPKSGILEADVWEQVLRHEATRSGVLTEIFRTAPGAQGEALGNLESHHLNGLVLVVDPEDATAAPALAQLHKQGMPVVLLDRSVAIDGIVFPTVVQPSPIEDAQKLIKAAVEDATKQGLSPSGPAVVLINGPYDEKGRARIDAVKAALKQAGVEVVPDAVFRGFMKEASEALTETLQKHPTVSIVIADEDQGARAAGTVRDNLEEGSKGFVLAAFGQSPEVRHMANFNLFAALVERDLEKQAATALATAIKLARGESIPPGEILVPSRFSRGSGPPMRKAPGTPKAAPVGDEPANFAPGARPKAERE